MSSCAPIAVTVDQVRTAWEDQCLYGHQTQDSPLTVAFFDPRNVEWIRSEIERRLKIKTGEENLRYYINAEFAQTMIDTALNNQGYAYNVEYGLPRLNQWVINKEEEIAYLSLRAQKRYEHQMLYGNRMRVFPYGVGDRTLHAKGENQVTQSPYLLNHPWKSQHEGYLNQVLKINNGWKPSACNNYRPKFPNP